MRWLAERAFLSQEHRIFRKNLRRYVAERMAPRVQRWEDERTFPRELYVELAEVGYLGVGGTREVMNEIIARGLGL